MKHMYINGRFSDTPLDKTLLDNIIQIGRKKADLFSEIPIEEIISVLNATGKLWHEKSKYFNEACKHLGSELQFDSEMISETLKVIPELLNEKNLYLRITSEFDNYKCLNTFIKTSKFDGSYRAFPLGMLLHITAGNVFIGCIDSLLMGFLTKNISILKLSHKNMIFPKLFVESLLEADKKNILSDKFSMIYFSRQ